MNYKHTKAEKDTVTRNTSEIEAKTGNIYESISVISNRANQITEEIRVELSEKLESFALPNDNLEEIFENREQIEISKFYEKMPKPVAISVDEFMNDKIDSKLKEVEEKV